MAKPRMRRQSSGQPHLRCLAMALCLAATVTHRSLSFATQCARMPETLPLGRSGMGAASSVVRQISLAAPKKPTLLGGLGCTALLLGLLASVSSTRSRLLGHDRKFVVQVCGTNLLPCKAFTGDDGAVVTSTSELLSQRAPADPFKNDVRTIVSVPVATGFSSCAFQSNDHAGLLGMEPPSMKTARLVGGARCSSARKSSSDGWRYAKRQRRHIGFRFQALGLIAQPAPSFDASRVRRKIQVGLHASMAKLHHPRSREPRMTTMSEGVCSTVELLSAFYNSWRRTSFVD
eukprot:TRINITY_DN90534_c0_g1_i1.p1 TRINITY_DN90534_c0_g1~~TRINITY_DN90534_c0_g1_i1.p1  ORF type:complete len:320 (+),score=18.11 TRINITY_DN90534_c0_g1_i1:95-961(+)